MNNVTSWAISMVKHWGERLLSAGRPKLAPAPSQRDYEAEDEQLAGGR
jgi:hypothetical protein